MGRSSSTLVLTIDHCNEAIFIIKSILEVPLVHFNGL